MLGWQSCGAELLRSSTCLRKRLYEQKAQESSRRLQMLVISHSHQQDPMRKRQEGKWLLFLQTWLNLQVMPGIILAHLASERDKSERNDHLLRTGWHRCGNSGFFRTRLSLSYLWPWSLLFKPVSVSFLLHAAENTLKINIFS